MSVWDVKYKLAISAKTWTEAKLGVDSLDGLVVVAVIENDALVKRDLWCLEAFLRQRRNPKLPMLHCQFDANQVRQINPGIKRYNTSSDLIIDFTRGNKEESFESLSRFEKDLIDIRRTFLEEVQRRLDLQAARKAETYIAKYQEIINAIQQRREISASRKRTAESEQLAVARRAVLEANPDIMSSFNLLVEQERSVAEEVFWKRHHAKVKAMLPLPTLDEPFFDFTLNADDDKMLAALLVESPYIQKRYTELVEGGRLNQKEFWHRLFSSRYFGKLVGDQLAYIDPTLAQEDKYFNAPDERDEREEKSIAAQELLPADIDVTSLPENPNSRESQAELGPLGPNGTQLVTAAGEGGTTEYLEGGLSFADRLNRMADRTLHERVEKACYFSVPTSAIQTSQLDRIYQIGDENQLSAIASLMSLEASLNSVKSAPTMNIRGQVCKLRRKKLEDNVIMTDLNCESSTLFQGGQVIQAAKPNAQSELRREQLVNQMKPANRVDRSVYAGKLRAAIADYRPQLDITADETTAKVCYVKFTKQLANTTTSTRQQQLTELLKNESVLRYVEEVALVQNKLTELIHYVYDDKLEKNPALLRQNLSQLQIQVETLMRHEIDAEGAGVMNSRTLCRPILYELEQAQKALG